MSDEKLHREAIKKSKSFFSGAGVYYMVHNAGDGPLICTVSLFLSSHFVNYVVNFNVYQLKFWLWLQPILAIDITREAALVSEIYEI